MEKSVVALVPIDTYEQQAVDDAVAAGFRLLGGVEQFVHTHEKILLKPNLLGKALPQRAVTTHPAVFAAVAKLLQAAGYNKLSYGDSPAPSSSPEQAAASCGIAEEAQKLGIPMADFHTCHTVKFPEGTVCRSFALAQAAIETDAIINICKMKTHALERITGAVKNIFGCVQGINKGAGHVAYPNSAIFADMLTDLHRCLQPRLHIMDGIMAMEGNGPTSGTPTPMHVLLFSADPVALDAVFATLIHLPPALVPTCVSGERGGIGHMQEQNISIVTPDGPLSFAQAQARYGKPDFDVFRGAMRKSLVAKLLTLIPAFQEHPIVDQRLCTGCGICEHACPVPEKAVHSGKGQKAVYDYHKCVRCYCCQEVCPSKAISVKHSKLGRIITGK